VRVLGNALASAQLSKLGTVQLSVLGSVLGSVQSSAFDKCTICSVMYSIRVPNRPSGLQSFGARHRRPV